MATADPDFRGNLPEMSLYEALEYLEKHLPLKKRVQNWLRRGFISKKRYIGALQNTNNVYNKELPGTFSRDREFRSLGDDLRDRFGGI